MASDLSHIHDLCAKGGELVSNGLSCCFHWESRFGRSPWLRRRLQNLTVFQYMSLDKFGQNCLGAPKGSMSLWSHNGNRENILVQYLGRVQSVFQYMSLDKFGQNCLAKDKVVKRYVAWNMVCGGGVRVSARIRIDGYVWLPLRLVMHYKHINWTRVPRREGGWNCIIQVSQRKGSTLAFCCLCWVQVA